MTRSQVLSSEPKIDVGGVFLLVPHASVEVTAALHSPLSSNELWM